MLSLKTKSMLTALLYCCSVFLIDCGDVNAGNMKFREIEMEEAKKAAAQEGKNIFLVVSSKTCPGSKGLKEFLNSQLSGKIASDYFIPVEFIIGDKRGADIARKLGGNGFPRTFILDENGDVLYSLNGMYKNKDYYYPFILKGVRGDKKMMKNLVKMVDKEFKSKKTKLAPYLIMVTARYKSGSKKTAKKMTKSYLKKNKDLNTFTEFAWAWVYNMECDGKTALKYAKEYKKKKDNGYSTHVLAWAYYLNGDTEKAISCMEEAIKILGKKAKVHHKHVLERFKREHAKKNGKDKDNVNKG